MPKAHAHTASNLVRSSPIVGALLLLVAAGCAGDPPPEPAAPKAVASATPSAAPKKDPPTSTVPDSPTASNIHIDDAILKACGIAAPKSYFAFDSAHLQPAETAPLEAVARCFTTGPLKGRSLKLVGHADPRGETEYNFVLGNSRADSVGGFVRSKGMDKAKVQTTSRGELDANGTEEEGWARDRRVDMLLAP